MASFQVSISLPDTIETKIFGLRLAQIFTDLSTSSFLDKIHLKSAFISANPCPKKKVSGSKQKVNV